MYLTSRQNPAISGKKTMKSRILGNNASNIVALAVERLGNNQVNLFDAVQNIYEEDKKDAVQALKQISDTNSSVIQALILLRAGEIQLAMDLLENK